MKKEELIERLAYDLVVDDMDKEVLIKEVMADDKKFFKTAERIYSNQDRALTYLGLLIKTKAEEDLSKLKYCLDVEDFTEEEIVEKAYDVINDLDLDTIRFNTHVGCNCLALLYLS